MRTIGLCFFIAGQCALAAVSMWLSYQSLEASILPGPVVAVGAGPLGTIQAAAPALAVAAGLAMTLLAFKFALAGGARWGGAAGVAGLVFAAAVSIGLSFDVLYRATHPNVGIAAAPLPGTEAVSPPDDPPMPIAAVFGHLATPGAIGLEAAILLAIAAAIDLGDLAGIALMARRPQPARREPPVRRPVIEQEAPPAHLMNRRRESPFVESDTVQTDRTPQVEKAVQFGRRRRIRR